MMSWELLSIIAAFGQAVSWTLKKKTLENLGIDKTLGVVAYFTAGIVLIILWSLYRGEEAIELKTGFTEAAFITISLNVVAAWAGFKALNYGKFTMLMPFIALTALGIVVLEYFLRDILPTKEQFGGILLIILGGIIFSLGAKIDKVSRKAAMLFGVTLTCYAITSTYMGVMQETSGDPLFSAAIMHLGIGLGFVLLLLVYKNENTAITQLKEAGKWRRVLGLMFLTGLIIGLLENWPIFTALQEAYANEVFALKRTMPIFALIIGVILFRETVLWRHKVGTILMILGAVLVTYYKP